MMIQDDDCDTEYPGCLDDDRHIEDPFYPQKATLLLASVHVARLLASLAKLFRSLCITNDATQIFEVHLENCLHLFPQQFQPEATGPLDPLTIAPILYFQNTRLLLYRHNMSPACSTEQRYAAIDQCAMTAQATADIVSRCFASPGPSEQVNIRLRVSATFLLCTHLWRCMLFLAFRQRWKWFHILLRFVALIGESKPINISCGRHLSFFLHKLIERHQSSELNGLEGSEDLLVLLSGDLQAGTNSWVWGDLETGTHLSRRQKHNKSMAPISGSSAQSETSSWNSHLSPEEKRQWGGWQKVYEAAIWLEEAQESALNMRMNTHTSYQQSREPQNPESKHATGQGNDTARSRMTIASITDL